MHTEFSSDEGNRGLVKFGYFSEPTLEVLWNTFHCQEKLVVAAKGGELNSDSVCRMNNQVTWCIEEPVHFNM